MKSIFFFFFFIMGIGLYANEIVVNECRSDIYFGNGVWNDRIATKKNLKLLKDATKDRILSEEGVLTPTPDSITNDEKYHWKNGSVGFKYAFNWHKTKFDDLFEAYTQLRDAGQFDDIFGFFKLIDYMNTMREGKAFIEGFIDYLKKNMGHFVLDEATIDTLEESLYNFVFIDSQKALLEQLVDEYQKNIANTELLNLLEMLNHYAKESYQPGHKVILVAHSQGNLFGNTVYDNIEPEEYHEYFRMVSVATPASEVAGEGGNTFVNLDNDPISSVPGSLGNNSTVHNPNRAYLGPDALGNYVDVPSNEFHAFSYYMEAGIKKNRSTKKMVLDYIENHYMALAARSSQWRLAEENFCATGTMVSLKHRFDTALPEIGTVYFADPQGKLKQIEGRYIMSKCTDTNNTNATAKDGIVTVGLTWKYPEIDMDLAFTAGTKDLSDLNDTAFEHYYVETKEQMPPGTYPIEVNRKGIVDGQCLKTNPEILILTVKTPDGGDMLAAVVEDKLSLL